MSGPTDTDAPAQDEQEIRYVQSPAATSSLVNAGAGQFATRPLSRPIIVTNNHACFRCSTTRR
jgi:hypothetical protein